MLKSSDYITVQVSHGTKLTKNTKHSKTEKTNEK